MSKIKEYVKQNKLLVEWIIFLIGIISLISAAFIENNAYVSNLLLNVGSGFLISAIISFILSSLILSEDNIDEKLLKEYSIQVINYLGLYNYKDDMQHFIKTKGAIIHTFFHYDINESRKLIQCYLVEKEVIVGYIIQTKLKYFIDLMEAVSSEKNINTLANHMCYLIEKTRANSAKNGKPIIFNKIASPKGGNPVLAALVAQKLKKKCILYNEEDLFTNNMGPLEGNITPGEEIIIVHDVITSGNRIYKCAKYLIEEKKAMINHVFVFVERTDSKIDEHPREVLSKNKINLYPLHKYNDITLAELHRSKL